MKTIMKTEQTEADAQFLAQKANQLRQDTLAMLHKAGSGHPGGSLSAMDVLTTLYYRELHVDPENPEWEDRDRFVLSKGHACPALYAILADKGFFPRKELDSLRKTSALLQGSTDRKVPGVEISTGSLGQGLSAGVGMALGARYLEKDFRVYVMIGDGESQEGQIWEAAMSAGHFKLSNLVAILDYNKLQGSSAVGETMNLEPIADKWSSFGWHVIEIDGHDFGQILEAFAQAKQCRSQPAFVIANTIKGKGVSFMENMVSWHGSKVPNKEELSKALQELREEKIEEK